MRRLFLVVLMATAMFTSLAFAKVPSGKYAGYYGQHTTSKVSFTVSGGFIHNFRAFVPAYCISGNFEFVTYVVPQAKIKAGKVDTHYDFRNDKGLTIGHAHLTARFNGGRASGTLGGSYVGCTIATYQWKAHH